MPNNIIDSIRLSGTTYQIQGSGGGITVDPTLDSGSTNPVANSAITTALGDKVNVADNNVSAYTFENKISGVEYGYSEHFAGPIYIRYTGSTSSSGVYYAGSITYYTNEWGWESIGLYFNLSNGQITATTVSSAYFDIEIENGEAVLTFKDGYYLRQYESRNGFVALTKTAYESGQSADVIEDTVYDVFDKLNDKLDDKQDTLVSGTNIKTINNESILGSGNIDIQGGSSYTAGRGISIANDTISFSLPISAGTGSNSIIEGDGTKARGINSHAEGDYTTAAGLYSHAEGSDTIASGESSHSEGDSTIANGDYSHTEGYDTIASNKAEHASGQYNVSSSASTTFGDSGNTLFSVGNGTADLARHNAFEIRQNGDIYLTLDGQDVKLQDQLGGSSITIDPSLDSGSTNAVANSAITEAIANATDGRLKEDLVFSGSCGYGTIHTDVGMVGDKYLIINTYPSTKISFTAFRSRNENYKYEIVIQDIATKDTYRAYYYYTYKTITSSGGTGINYATVSYVGSTQTFTVNDGYRIIGLVRDNPRSNREHYSYICTYNANIPSGTTLSELFRYIANVNANLKGLTKSVNYGVGVQNYADEYGGELYYQQTVFPTNDSFTRHTASTVMHTTQAEKDSWNGKLDTSAITTSITSGSTDAQVPSAKAVNDKLGGLSLVKLTQAEYDALETKDNSTLYVIVN